MQTNGMEAAVSAGTVIFNYIDIQIGSVFGHAYDRIPEFT